MISTVGVFVCPRFVDLILREGAHVDVKNKKGNSPLWLAANGTHTRTGTLTHTHSHTHTSGGHLDVVKLLVDHGSDLDSQDNRKVSCLMAGFRKVCCVSVLYAVEHL